MKKILSAMFLAFAGMSMVFAQDLQVKVNGEDVVDGGTVSMTGGLDLKAQFQLTNNTEADMSIKAVVDIAGLPEGCSYMLCGFGTCFLANETQPYVLAAGDTYGDVQMEDFHLEFIADATGKTWSAPVTLTDENTGKEFKLTIVYESSEEEVVPESDLAVMINGQAVEDGGTFTIQTDELDVKAQFQLTNNTEADMSIKAVVDIAGLPEGCSYMLCGFGTCFLANETQPYVLAAGDTYGDVQMEDFHLEFIADATGKTWSAPMTLTDTVSGLEFKVTVEYVIGSVANEGLDAAEISAYPNPASEEVHFMLANVKAGSKVVLRDMNGRVVESVAVKGETELSMNLEALNAGVYFYSVEENGKAVVTRKLVVR